MVTAIAAAARRVALDLRHDGAPRARHQLLLVVVQVVRRRLLVARVAVDLRHDVAREQLPRAERRLAVRPVVREAEHDAEAAGDLLQVADRRHQLVGRADDGRAGARSRRARPSARAARRRPRRGSRPAARARARCTRCASAAGRRFASFSASFFDSARCQLISTRQFLRSTVLPCFAAASSANDHCVGSACSPSDDVDAIDSTPMPYLPAICMPGRADRRRRRHRHVLLQRQDLELRVAQREPVAVVAEALLAAQQPDDHAERLVLAVALHHRVDAERVRVRRQRARPGAEHRAAPRHVVELHDALRHVERVVIRQRHDARAEHDPLRPLARRRQEHLRRGDHLPAGRVVLAAPELVEAEAVEVRRRSPGRAGTAASGARRVGWCGARNVPNFSLVISLSPVSVQNATASPRRPRTTRAVES